MVRREAKQELSLCTAFGLSSYIHLKEENSVFQEDVLQDVL